MIHRAQTKREGPLPSKGRSHQRVLVVVKPGNALLGMHTREPVQERQIQPGSSKDIRRRYLKGRSIRWGEKSNFILVLGWATPEPVQTGLHSTCTYRLWSLLLQEIVQKSPSGPNASSLVWHLTFSVVGQTDLNRHLSAYDLVFLFKEDLRQFIPKAHNFLYLSCLQGANPPFYLVFLLLSHSSTQVSSRPGSVKLLQFGAETQKSGRVPWSEELI